MNKQKKPELHKLQAGNLSRRIVTLKKTSYAHMNRVGCFSSSVADKLSNISG